MMKRILVVDDDADLAEMVIMLLKHAGMDVKSINTGGLFFDSLNNFMPDIILMDIYLGDHDGRNLCRELKTFEKFRLLPVILYSAGHISKVSVRESLADDFMAKPFDIGELLKKIKSFTA